MKRGCGFYILHTVILFLGLLLGLSGCGSLEGNDAVALNAREDDITAKKQDESQDQWNFFRTTVEPSQVGIENSVAPSIPEMPVSSAEEVVIRVFDGDETPIVDSYGDPLPETVIGSMSKDEGLIQRFDQDFISSVDANGNPLPEVALGG
ncbi:MAG: hypothetical protein HY283_04470 [Nitrospirae bacterium]|nr:hypothetical protein [Nitrospirota bacterium]